MALYVENTPAGQSPGDPCRAGDIAGDNALTDGWSRRFVRAGGPVDGLHAVVEIAYCVTLDDDDAVTLAREVSYTLCTDSERPGETEFWADVRYDRVTWSRADTPTPTDDTAYAACRAVRAELLTWDGHMLPTGATHPVRTDLPDSDRERPYL